MKLNFKRIVSFILVLVMLTGMLSINVFAAEPAAQAETTVDIISKNVMYGERYYLMFAVDAQNVPEGGSVELVATKNGVASNVTKRDNETVKGVDAHIFAVNKGVAAQDIDVLYTAKAQIKDADGNVVAESATYIYSVLEYLNERLYVSTNVSATDKALYEAFIDFAIASEDVLTPDKASIADSAYAVNINGTVDGTNKGGIYNVGDVITDLTTDVVAEDGKELYYVIEAFDAAGLKQKTTEIKVDEFESYTIETSRTEISVEIRDAGAVEVPKAWTLLTDVSDLEIGAQIIIVASASNVALSTTQNTNNRGQVAITKSSDKKTLTGEIPTAAQIITVEAGTSAGSFAFKTEKGYLYASGTSGNQLKSTATLTAKGSWTIAISTAGVATIKAVDTSVRGWMRYNSQSSLFACYSSGQQDISIYMYK